MMKPPAQLAQVMAPPSRPYKREEVNGGLSSLPGSARDSRKPTPDLSGGVVLAARRYLDGCNSELVVHVISDKNNYLPA